MDKKDIDIDSPYKEHGIKDFNNIYDEYTQWKSISEKNDWGVWLLPYKPPVMIFKTDFKQHFKKK